MFLASMLSPLDDSILDSTSVSQTLTRVFRKQKKNLNISATSGSYKCMHDDHECFNSRSSAAGQLSSRDVPENVKPGALDGVKEDYHPSAPVHASLFTKLLHCFQCLQCSCTLYVYRCLCVDFPLDQNIYFTVTIHTD